MSKMVLATSNPGKLKEFQSLLQDLPFELVSQSDLDIVDVLEVGLSFIENAILKARHAAKESHYPALADDSGLVVDALNGSPGIYSARYAGGKDSQANIAKLLHEMRDVPDEKRTAQFYCVIALVRHADDPMPIIATGSWRGEILTTPRGEGGFGYDSVFYVPSHHCSAAEMPKDTKNQISHRARAITKLLSEFTVSAEGW